MTTPLTSQERKVLFFFLFLFFLGLALSFLKKSSGSSCCPLNFISERRGIQTLDLNQATREELIVLPEIGEKTADAILGYRVSHGRFTTLDELKNIKGISDAKLTRLKEYLFIR